MLVKEIMTDNVITVTEDSLLSTAARIMIDNKFSGLPVVDNNGKVVSMITKSSIVELSLPSALKNSGEAAGLMGMKNTEYLAKLQDVSKKTVESISVKKTIIYATPEMTISEVASKMYAYGYRRLPVLSEDKKIIGIITYTDIAALIAEK